MTASLRLPKSGALFAISVGLFAGGLAVIGSQTNPLFPVAVVGAIAVVALALQWPVHTAYLAVLAVPAEAAVPSLGGFLSPAEILLLAAAVGWLARTLAKGGEIPRSPLIPPFLALLACHVPGLFLAVNPFAVFKQLFMWTALLILFMAVISDTDKRTPLRMAAAIALSGALVAAIAIFKNAGAPQVAEAGGGLVTNRAVGPFASPVLLGTYIMVTAPFQLFFTLRGRTDLIRIVGGIGVLISVGALGLALSRSAMVAVAAAFVWIMIWWPPARRVALIGAIVLAALLATRFNPAPSVFKPEVLVERLKTITEPSTHTLSLRVRIWKKSPEIIADNIPFGIGPKNLPDRAAEYELIYAVGAPSNAHNTVLVIATELGIAGLMVVAWLVIALIGVLSRALRITREPERSLAVACAAVFVALVADSVTGYSFGANAYSLVVMLIVAVAVRVERTAMAPAPASEAEPAPEAPPRQLALA